MLNNAKILYIITQADGGGAQKYVLSLAKHFGGAIAAGFEAEKLFQDAKELGIPTFQLKYLKRNINPFYEPLAFLELKKLIKKQRPDIVHLNSSKAGFLGSLAGKLAGAKVIFTAHGFIFNEPRPWIEKQFYLILEKWASRFRDFIITVSNADKESALRHHLINEHKISTIHNGIPNIDFLPQEEARLQLGIDTNKFIFGTVANFYKTKGLHILIQAVLMLSDEIKNQSLFLIIGDGPEFNNLKSKIKNLGLENIIKTLGQIDNAAKYLRALDCFVLPSLKEGFPYVLLEAMQAGLPIIATNVGGNKEALDEAGLIIPPNDPHALKTALAACLGNNKPSLDILSKRAMLRSKLFLQERMLKETGQVYEQILTT